MISYFVEIISDIADTFIEFWINKVVKKIK